MKSGCLFALALAACGFRIDAAPDSPVIDARADDAPVDGAPADADLRFCIGAGFGRVCLTTEPTQPLELPNAELDTGVATNCTQLATLDGVEHCVLAGRTIDVPLGVFFRARGSRPLILVAAQTISISGTASASTLTDQTPGAGALAGPCAPAGIGEEDQGGAAGGAGGSFGGSGGAGGTGDTNISTTSDGNAIGGMPAPTLMPSTIRGGCAGGAGGLGRGAGGAGGRGGGAIYMIAGTSITVTGTGRIYAVGEGGKGGFDYAGGGGGGSGGFIGLDAPAIMNSNFVIANGGGGGEGAPNGVRGGAGFDGPSDASCAAGGSGWLDAGNGGVGSCAGSAAGAPGLGDVSGGGGGGGGTGFIYLKGALISTGVISPNPSVAP